MANIAQLVNVLQAVILTEGEKMILTPTYHVFEMFKAHQNGQLLESYVESKEIGIGESKVVNLTESVSKDKDGNIHITMNNLSLDETYSIESIILNKNIRSVRSV